MSYTHLSQNERYQIHTMLDLLPVAEIATRLGRHESTIRRELARNLVLKCVFGYTKTRFKGLAKNTSQVVLLFALVNLHRAREKLMAIKERQESGKFKAEVRLKTA